MIIEFPSPPVGYRVRPPRQLYSFFPNNNLAIRAACAKDLGAYDLTVRRSEDVDLCVRAARSGRWILCREPGVVVRHKGRSTAKGALRQFWGWGSFIGLVYRKTGETGLFWYLIEGKRGTIARRLELPGGPVLVCVMWSDWHSLHAWILLGGLCALFGYWLVGGVALALGAIAFGRILRTLRKAKVARRRLWRSAAWYWVANAAFVLSSVVGGLRQGVIFIPASFQPVRPRDLAATA